MGDDQTPRREPPPLEQSRTVDAQVDVERTEEKKEAPKAIDIKDWEG